MIAINTNTKILIAGNEVETGRTVVRFDLSGLSLYPMKKFTARNLNLAQLSKEIKNLTLHHSVTYNVKQTYATLISRQLSVNFAIDDDFGGTIYQFLDVKDAGWSQGNCNKTGAGIEICYRPEAWKNIELYSIENQKKYHVNSHKMVNENIRNSQLKVFGPSQPQLESLVSLIVAYCNTFSNVKAEFPRNKDGKILKNTFLNAVNWRGLLTHFQIDNNKIDPCGIDLDWLEKEVKTRLALGY